MEQPPPQHYINPSLTEISQHLHFLLESACHVQVLKGKWLLITAKLTALLNSLSSIPIAAASTEDDSVSSEFFRSVFDTCSAASSLTILCSSPTLPNGKLKTQNDLDSLSAKLDAHISDMKVLIKSGILSENAAVSIPASGSSSRAESVRAEARNLMTRLQIGSTESRSSALDSLLGLLQEDDKNVVIAVAQGMIPILVQLMNSSLSTEIREKSVTAIAKISTVDSSKDALVAEGLVLLNNLLRVIESGSKFAKEKSCIVLNILSCSKENARAIVSRGGISSMLRICQLGTPNTPALATRVLWNLSLFEEIKKNVIEDNAVPTLLELCKSCSTLVQENSIGCLYNLVSKNDDLKLMVAREGGIESLAMFWDSAPSVQNLEEVVEMVRSLASCREVAKSLVAMGFLDRLVGVLNCGVLGVRIAAAEALYNLAYNNKIRKELGEMGCMDFLVSMLDGKAVEEKEVAAKVLSTLMNYAGNRQIFRKDEKGISMAVQLLDPKLQNLNRKYVVLMLGSLVDSNKCRKQMVKAGARLYLDKLVELEAEGAKKLLDGLRQGKLWGSLW